MGDVVDYSWARPSPRAIRQAGYTGVVRYLSNESGKNLSSGERDALWAEGLQIGLVWETSASRPLGGYQAGLDDAREANRQADALGWPAGVPLVYAVDFSPAPGQLGLVREYFRGAKDARRRPVGAYGAYGVVEDLVANEPVACYWQCAAWSGFGSGSGGAKYVPEYGRDVRLSRHACLFQDPDPTPPVAGTDHNFALMTAEFLWHPDIAPMEDDDMPTLEEIGGLIDAAKNDIGGWLQGERGWSGAPLVGLHDGGIYTVLDTPEGLRKRHITSPEEVTAGMDVQLWQPALFVSGDIWGEVPRPGVLPLSPASATIWNEAPLAGPDPGLTDAEKASLAQAVVAGIAARGVPVTLTAESISAQAKANADEEARRLQS